jgi:hypothetical protein
MIDLVKEKLQECDESLSSLKNCAFELNHEFSNIKEKVNSLDSKSLDVSEKSFDDSHIERILETLENNSCGIVQPLRYIQPNKCSFGQSKSLGNEKSANEDTSELSESDYTSSSSDESSDEDYGCHEENYNYPSKYNRLDKSVNDNCNKLIRMLLHSSSQK